MITFKQYLQEDSVGKAKPKYSHLSLEEAYALIREKCSDALWMLKENRPIWRGDPMVTLKTGYATVDPSLTRRRSANTANHYTEIFDNVDSWKDWPKRSRSFIAHSDKQRALEYGADWGQDEDDSAVFAMIPFNGVEIGLVNKHDMWDVKVSVFGLTKKLADMNDVFGDELLIDGKWSAFEKAEKKIKKDASYEEMVRRVLKATPDDNVFQFLKEINRAYSPIMLRLSKCTTATIKHQYYGEVWVAGPVVVVHNMMWRDLVNEFGRNKSA